MAIEEPYKKPVFPDLERERVEKAIKSKEWGNCPKCDWFYRHTVLKNCPMCRHPWGKHVSYKQPPYESSSIS